MPRLIVISFLLCSFLVGCSSTTPLSPPGETPPVTEPNPTTPTEPTSPETPAPEPTPTTLTPEEADRIALTLWRNDDLGKHPKGSCSGCHGADYFDLARIGSADEDIARRAVIDGASQREADALVQAVGQMRQTYGLVADDARAFRPFQPGGEVLLPNLDDAEHIVSVERDIAFGHQLEALLPTLFGERIASLADAERARDELLDLAQGANQAGANSQRIQLRELPTGITYPRWSADLHHGADEGTLNDWLADVAHDAKPEHREAWLGLQDAYLATPSDENFWRMYLAAEEMTATPLFGECTMTGGRAHIACADVKRFAREKFLSALTGQHMMRLEASGREGFAEGALAFSYLDTDPRFDFMKERKSRTLLPANLWEVGDKGRSTLENSQAEGSFRENLAKLGYPEFVQGSIDPTRSASQEQHELRLAWFWLGFTFDPSFARIHSSNATKVGEYMVGTLLDERMFIHNTFHTNMRLVTKGFLPEANREQAGRERTLEQLPTVFRMNYGYFWAYGRTVLNWRENKKLNFVYPEDLKAEQADLWHRFTANGFRMSMFLYLAALEEGAPKDSVAFDALTTHFETYEPEHQEADNALMAQLRRKLEE